LFKLKVLIVIVTLSILWGSSFLAIKIVVDAIHPVLVFGIRFLTAGIILLAIHYVMSFTFSRKSKTDDSSYYYNEIQKIGFWKDPLILAVFLIVGGQGLLAWGTQYLSSGVSALINSTIPLWVAIFALIFFGKKPTKMSIAGLVTGFVGLIILVIPSILDAEVNWIGIISLIISSIFWAIGSLYSNLKPVTKAHGRSIFVSAGMFMSTGGAILLIIFGIVNGVGKDYGLEIYSLLTDNNILTAFLFLTLICTVIGYAEFYWLLIATTASLANTFAYIVPVIAVILGWIILHEVITEQTIIATCVISIGVALMVLSPSQITSTSNKDSFKK
jgi:drug/metabolite transporter (DMT)-like permease